MPFSRSGDARTARRSGGVRDTLGAYCSAAVNANFALLFVLVAWATGCCCRSGRGARGGEFPAVSALGDLGRLRCSRRSRTRLPAADVWWRVKAFWSVSAEAGVGRDDQERLRDSREAGEEPAAARRIDAQP